MEATEAIEANEDEERQQQQLHGWLAGAFAGSLCVTTLRAPTSEAGAKMLAQLAAAAAARYLSGGANVERQNHAALTPSSRAPAAALN